MAATLAVCFAASSCGGANQLGMGTPVAGTAGAGAMGGNGGEAGGAGAVTASCPAPKGGAPRVAFQATAGWPTGGNLDATVHPLVADLDGDCRLDIAVATIVAPDSGVGLNAGAVVVLRNDGAGGFLPPASYPLSTAAGVLAGADMNGDGGMDLVALMESGAVAVLLNRGDGTFMPALDSPTGLTNAYRWGAESGFYASMAVGDLDGDGDQDVAVTGDQVPLQVLSNTGDGTLLGPTARDFPGLGPGPDWWAPPPQLVAANLDDDALPELLGTNAKRQLAVSATGSYGSFAIDVGGLLGFAVGDLNGDGRNDIVCAGASDLIVLLNQGQANFAQATYPFAQTVALGDMNGDGRLDIVAVEGETATILLNDGAGQFQASSPGADMTFLGYLAAADVNGDGWTDIVEVNATPILDGTVDVAFSRQGAFAPPLELDLTYQSRRISAIAVADLDGDGNGDVASIDLPPNLIVALNRGDGTLAPASATAMPSGAAVMALDDLDGDGDQDIIAVSFTSRFANYQGHATVLLNDGKATFGDAGAYPIGAGDGPVAVAIGDVNADGAPDFVVNAPGDQAGTIAGQLSLFLNAGGGQFTMAPGQAALGHPGMNPPALTLADLDGDGAAELIATYQG